MNGLQANQKLQSALNVNRSSGIEKKCSKCKNIKHIDDFGLNRKNKDGKSIRCKGCNRVSNREGSRRWRKNNPDSARAAEKRQRLKDKDKIRKRTALWRKNNPEKIKLIRQRASIKIRNDSQKRLSRSVSASILKSLKKNKNGNGWELLVGYTKEQLKKHLEKQFKDGMTWSNYGVNGWSIDHIVPRSAFNYEKSSDDDFKRCWSLNNLQPMWASENNKKQNKLYKPFQPGLIFK